MVSLLVFSCRKDRQCVYPFFQNVLELDLGIFKVQIQSERGTNSWKLFAILKLKTYLIFISGVVVHSEWRY